MILHAVGSLVGVLAIAFCYWLSIPAFAVFGFFWEKTQHRYIWFIDRGGKLQRKKTGWFGWVTKHRLLEAAGWPIGALVASVVWFLIQFLMR
jgi:hypothetical protein